MLIECTHCGAPLDVKADERRTTCAYCGRLQEVRSARTMEQPAGWKAPQQWTPPARFAAASTPLQRDLQRAAQQHARKSARGVLWGVGCTVLLSILIPGIIVAVVFSRTADAVERVASRGGAPAIDLPNIGVGSSSNQPLECTGPGSVIRTNADVNVQSGPAIIVRDGCQLRLINTTVRGKDGIRVEGSGEVTMVNGSIAVEGTAVFASGGSLTLTNVELSGKNGVATEGDATVRTINGSIRAEQLAIQARGTSTVSATNTDLSGEVEQDPTATVRR